MESKLSAKTQWRDLHDEVVLTAAVALMEKLASKPRQRWPMDELPEEWTFPGLVPQIRDSSQSLAPSTLKGGPS